MAMSTIEVLPHLFLVPFYNECIHVTVAREAQQVQEWICSIYKDFPKNLVIGLDTEWLPNLNPGEDHPISILQLNIGNRCLIFQLLHRDFIPASLRAFLADRRHMGSASKMTWRNYIIITNCACGKSPTLKKMAFAVLGRKMEKPLNVTLSKWDAVKLDRDQIEYAAIDAFLPTCLYIVSSAAKLYCRWTSIVISLAISVYIFVLF